MDRSAESNDGGFEYDRIAYPGTADGQIQLRNLEVVASMFGLHAAELRNCRVLEIGCADGTNLLPFAAEFPNSEFVGLDLAAAQIQEAESVAASLKIHNTRFLAKNSH
ncbi:MAG: class I SAM-dependent methyltransferase [Fuerstiella sp.]